MTAASKYSFAVTVPAMTALADNCQLAQLTRAAIAITVSAKIASGVIALAITVSAKIASGVIALAITVPAKIASANSVSIRNKEKELKMDYSNENNGKKHVTYYNSQKGYLFW
jgi:hypothetical protein